MFDVQAFLKITLIIPVKGQKGKGCMIPDGPHANIASVGIIRWPENLIRHGRDDRHKVSLSDRRLDDYSVLADR